MLSALVACNKADTGASDTPAAGASAETTAASSSDGACNFVSTKDDSPLVIKVVATDTPEAKQFIETCINPYTKLYAKDAEAAKAGKKQYAFQGCSGCHGGNANGLMGPSIIDAQWEYTKHNTDKGMFETIAGGTLGKGATARGSMLTWHNQLPGHSGDGLDTDTILKIMAWLRTQYVGGGATPWLDEKPQ
ncbi:MAG: c-type cytochrome [Methylotenera sp.]